MLVAIGVPSGDMVHADFAFQLVNLVAYSMTKGIQTAIVNPRFSLLEIGRCEIIKRAAGLGAEKVFMLDSDMTFPHDALDILLSHKKEVACCDASRRREPFTSVVRDANGRAIDHANTCGLVELSRATTACLLTDMGVFDKIPMPPFRVSWDETKKQFLGEDYYFSTLCSDAKIKMFCDTDLSKDIGHIGTKTYHLPKYNLLK